MEDFIDWIQNIGVTMNINDGFPLLSTSIKKCAAGMSGWSIADLTIGLYRLYQCHLQEGVIDTISGSQVQDIEELEEMCYWLKWAFAAYNTDRSSIAEYLQISEMQIKKHVKTSAVLRPSYYIAVDNVKGCLVMAIRGTQSTTDIVTDLNPHSENFERGHAHSGMLAAAKWLMDEEDENLQILMKTYPVHKIVLTGHSLGAGTASLLYMLLQEAFFKSGKNADRRLKSCWGFGCPPCVDEKLSQETTDIKNIVLQDDIISRLSPAALEELHWEISKTDWAQTLPEDDKIKKIVELVQTTNGVMNGIEASLGYEQGHFYKQIKSFGQSSLTAAKEMITTQLAENQRNTNQSNSKTVSYWLSFGASTVISYAEMFSAPSADHSQTRTGVAANIVANAAAREDTIKSGSCDARLYIPGILYHIIRKNNSRNVQQVSLSNRMSSSNNPKECIEVKITGKDSTHCPHSVENYEDKNESTSENVPPMQYTVTRSGDPALRFKRIVLSNSMFSDHSCQSYQNALEAALDHARI